MGASCDKPDDDCIDRAILDCLAAVERAQPGRIRAVYLGGSFCDNTQVPGSDVDLTIILRNPLTQTERQNVTQAFAGRSDFDVDIIDESALARGISPQLKQARLIRGEDLREHYPLIPIQSWTLERMKTSYWRLAKLFERRVPLTIPLTYPDRSDEFYGYIRRTMTDANGNDVPCTRDLVRAVGWATTAIVAYVSQKYVPCKRECAGIYASAIGDEWSAFLEELHGRSRTEWQYQVPESRSARLKLRELCGRTLGFENHFLAKFRYYALEQLRAGDAQSSDELRSIFERIPIIDPEIRSMLA